MADADNVTQLHRRCCPICDKPATVRTRPFCSDRCRDLDLWRWLKGGYRLPTEEPMGERDFEPDGEPQ